MFTVTFDEEAIAILNKFSRDVRERIFLKIMATKDNPFRFFERLVGRKDYKLRVGDYRVIADIDQKTRNIHVTLIGHRKNVYLN